MPFDSDVVIVGTGVAPLVAANQLLAQDRSVLLLNPDPDFFLEDSELPLDPMLPTSTQSLAISRVVRSSAEHALMELQPSFPGAVEFWADNLPRRGFHDPLAPHVRQRSRLWLSPDGISESVLREWDLLETLYVEASDSNLNPQILDGVQPVARFPGAAAATEGFRGLLLPKFYDVDVGRYRNGLLEFVRERLGNSRVICGAGQIELMPEGIRFNTPEGPSTARVDGALLVFWTPRLTQWILAQAKRSEARPSLPRGIRLWEEWSLVSRDLIDPQVVGNYRDMLVWAEAEGAPGKSLNRLSVLRAGPLVPVAEFLARDVASGETWASSESFERLFDLCSDLMKWSRLSVRSMKPRALFEWGEHKSFGFEEDFLVRVVGGCDGPLVDAVRAGRQACRELERRLSEGVTQ